MKSISKTLLFLCILSALFASTATATPNYTTPEKYQVTKYMNNYNLNNENNSLQLACEIGQYVSSEYGWNCDIRQLNFTKHAPIYINVFYPAADTKKGYEAYYGWFGPQKKEVTTFWSSDKKLYYRDWYEPGKECYISGVCSYGIVKSYYGNIQEGNTTEPISYEGNNTVEPVEEVPVIILNGSSDIENNTVENSTVETIEINNSEINNTVENSTNTVNNQGIIDSVKQYWFDFKNANLSNVSFNFWGN